MSWHSTHAYKLGCLLLLSPLVLASSAGSDDVCGYEWDRISWQSRIGDARCHSTAATLLPEPCGFGCDAAVIHVVNSVISAYNISTFVETRTFGGATLAHVARTFPATVTHAFSSEFDQATWKFATNENTEVIGLWKHAFGAGERALRIENADSATLLANIARDFPHILPKPALFWVSALKWIRIHGSPAGFP